MDILVDDLIPIISWQEFVVKNPHSTPFQTPEFYHICNSIPGFSSKAIAVRHFEAILSLAVIIIQKKPGLKSYFSRRGIIYGGPLIEPGFPEALDLLVSEINSTLGRDTIYIETRNFSDYRDYNQVFINHRWNFTPYINLTIDIFNKSLPDILAGMKYNRRREISLSLEKGAVYKECETETELKALYGILSDLYIKKVRLPLPDYLFFKALWLKRPGKVFIVLHNNRVIGGSFCLVQPGKSIYTMYYCGLRKYDRKIYPTHLAVLAALEYAVNNGLRIFDFMGAGKKNEEYGVRKYKQEFGGEVNEYGRYIRIQNQFLFIIGKIGLKISGLRMRSNDSSLFRNNQ